MSDTNSRFKAFLLDHPKLLGALFGMSVLLSQVSPVVAGNSNTISGP